MQTNPYAHEDREQLMDALLADNGTVWRRGVNENLTPDDFATLMRRMRDRLLALRELDLAEETPIALTDAGMAMAAARKAGMDPNVQNVLRRLGGVMSGRQLLAQRQETPARMRTVGRLGVIDGDRA